MRGERLIRAANDSLPSPLWGEGPGVRGDGKDRLVIPLADEVGTSPTDPVSVVSCLMATGSNTRGSHKADTHRHGVGGGTAIAARATVPQPSAFIRAEAE